MSFNFSSFMLSEMQAPVLAGSMGAAFTIIIERCAMKYRWHGAPLLHHTHTGCVPRIGGIAVVLAIAVGSLASGLLAGRDGVLVALLCSLPVLLVGAYDDFRHVSARTKLVVQVGAGTLFAWGVVGSLSPQALAAAVLLVCWVVVTTNSFNLVDGVDGLAAGVACLMGLSLALVNMSFGNVSLAAFSLTTAAACFAFLPFNLAGKRIFLGDSGSLCVGFLLAAIAALTARTTGEYLAAAVLYGFPLTETVLTVIRRNLKGRSIFRPDREHLHHKLQNAGFSPKATIGTLYLINLAFNCLGLMMFIGLPAWIGVSFAGLLFLMVAYAFGYLGGRSWRKLRQRLVAGNGESATTVPSYVSYPNEYSFGGKNTNN